MLYKCRLAAVADHSIAELFITARANSSFVTINEHGSAVILKERIALAKDQYSALEKELSASKEREVATKARESELTAENHSLKLDNENLRQEIQRRDDVIQKEKSHNNLLDDAKVKILLFLSKQPEQTIISSAQIAQYLQMDEQTVIHHLEKIIELKMKMVFVGHTMNAPKRWTIGPGGRSYLFKNGLLT